MKKFSLKFVALFIAIFILDGCKSITALAPAEKPTLSSSIIVLMKEKPSCTNKIALAIINTANHFTLDGAIEEAKEIAASKGATYVSIDETKKQEYYSIVATAYICK